MNTPRTRLTLSAGPHDLPDDWGSTDKLFWTLIDQSLSPDECWLWHGRFHPDGYAIYYVRHHRHRSVPVARILLTWKLGRPIGAGMYACHTCDNRGCANPAHIYEGTPADNGHDKAVRGRSRNGYTKDRLPALPLSWSGDRVRTWPNHRKAEVAA